MSCVRQWPERVWAVEGANGIGRPLAQSAETLAEAGHGPLKAALLPVHGWPGVKWTSTN